MRALLKGSDYHPGADAIQVMTMKVNKALEFPVVALPGVGHIPAPGEDEKEAARVFLCGGYAEVGNFNKWRGWFWATIGVDDGATKSEPISKCGVIRA